ncbi:MAG: HEAT repeat domain-containing protein [Planctomycetes bacterium]|nr:HEAT repeat domain-containing protein [Planctomycetota bacterium]
MPSSSSCLRASVLALLSLSLAPALRAQGEAVLVGTRAGQFLEAERVKNAAGRDELWWGSGAQRRQIPAGAVTSVRSLAELRAEHARLAENARAQPGSALGLARWCAANGLSKELAEALDPVLAKEPLHPGALALLRGLSLEHLVPAGRGEPDAVARGLVLYGGQHFAEPTTRTMAALRLPSLEGGPAAIERARKSVRGEERALALLALALSASEPRWKDGLAHAMLDADPRARRAAVALVKQSGELDLIQPFLRALGSAHPKVQIHAAEALGALGDPRAVDVLIEKLSYGAGARSYLLSVTQTSVISDYDVETAQASFIADPTINVLQDGEVLDAKVAGGGGQRTLGAVRGAVAGALRELTGVDHGTDLAAWRAWRAAHPAAEVPSAARGE